MKDWTKPQYEVKKHNQALGVKKNAAHEQVSLPSGSFDHQERDKRVETSVEERDKRVETSVK